MITALVGLTLVGPPTQAQTAAEPRRPNILFIMTDDHAAHALSCYGSRINKTPNLDRLARKGMLFRNCFCTNSICAPSRAVILTGKYSHLNGVINNGRRFDGAQQTFPKLLQQAGYQTAMVGKWHLKSHPTGFDYWNVLPGQGAYHNPAMIEMGKRNKHKGYTTDIITDHAIRFLDKRDRAKPFCLMYHHKAPHRNWQPDEKHAQMCDDVDVPEPETFDDDWQNRASAARLSAMSIERHLTKRDLKMPPPKGLEGQALKKWKYQRYIKDYLRCVAAVDDNVGRVLDYLDKEGLTDDTLVVYTSDQGFFLGDHGWFDKRFMYEESLRMPLLVRYPRMVKPGTVSDPMVLNLDFATTFLALAGVSIPGDMQGRSIVPLLRGEKPADWRTSFYYHYYEYPGAHSVRRHYGVRTERHKLIHYYRQKEWELFDLAKDPHEVKSVYADPAYAGLVKRLKAEIERHRGELKVPDDRAPEIVVAVGPQLVLLLAEPAGAKQAQDKSGKKRNLSYHGTKPAPGQDRTARELNGKGDHLDLDRKRAPSAARTPITVSAWIKLSKPDGVILAHGGKSFGYALHLRDGKPVFSLRVDDKLATVQAQEKLSSDWMHIVGRVERGGKMSLVVNGKPAASGKAPGLLPRTPNESLQIGCDSGSNIGDYEGSSFFGGLIGEVQVVYGQQNKPPRSPVNTHKGD